MCFTGEMSAAFAAIGLFSAYWVYSRTSNIELASGIFFFFTMEFLQAIQYYFIAPELKGNVDGTCPTVDSKYYDEVSPCDTVTNKVLTLLGFLHICLQPYYCHVINASLTKSCKYKGNSVFYFIIFSLVLYSFRSLQYHQAPLSHRWIFVVHSILFIFHPIPQHYGFGERKVY